MTKHKRETTKDNVLEAIRTLFYDEAVSHICDCVEPGWICVVFEDGPDVYLEIPASITDWDGEVRYPVQIEWRDATVQDLLHDSPIVARFTDVSPDRRNEYHSWHESSLAGYRVGRDYPWACFDNSNWKYCQVGLS